MIAAEPKSRPKSSDVLEKLIAFKCTAVLFGTEDHGSLYKGYFRDKQVAIKKLSLRNAISNRKFDAMLENNHPNLVKVVWSHEQGDFR
jgi:hypothetical protein